MQKEKYFGGYFCLHHQGLLYPPILDDLEDGGRELLRNIDICVVICTA
jgi:hypothetical protein